MAKRRQVSASALSHIGCERTNNEDNFFFNGDYMLMEDMDEGAWITDHVFSGTQLFAVCDGMGGTQYGERASVLAVNKMVSLLVKFMGGGSDALVETFCHEVSDDVYKDGVAHKAKTQGTTLAMVVLRKSSALVCNVGDSRVYLIRDGHIRRLSSDHSEVNRMYMAGTITAEQARKHPRGNVITQYIGMLPADKPKDFVFKARINLLFGDRIILCSDGLSDLLPDEEILLITNSVHQPQQAVKELVLRAMEMGGKDNITCIALDFGNGYPIGKNAAADIGGKTKAM